VARILGGQPAAIFYPFGHPILCAYANSGEKSGLFSFYQNKYFLKQKKIKINFIKK
jgi:hypothetical protein